MEALGNEERQFYLQWITQCMQMNAQLVNNMMQLAMSKYTPMISPQAMFTASAADDDSLKKLQHAWTDIPISNDFIKDMMSGFFPPGPKKDDRDKLTK